MSSLDSEVGKVLANVSSAPYTGNGGDRFSRGQCTWYCCGRAKEKCGVSLSPLLPAPANGGQWYSKITSSEMKRPASAIPTADCVASFSHGFFGHVVYVEAVENGYVYFSEYNWNQSQNGKLQKISISDFPHLHGCTLNGYITLKNLSPLAVIDQAVCDPETGAVTVSGWALNGAGLRRIDAYYDGAHGLTSSNAFTDRPDVRRAINPNGWYPDGSHCGFSVTIPAGKISDGKHTIGIAAVGKDGSVQWANKDVVVTTPIPAPIAWIDLPDNMQVSADFKVPGWGVAGAGVERIDIYADGKHGIASVRAFTERPDVDKIINPHGWYKDALHSGFSVTVPVSALGKGKHSIDAAVIAKDGKVSWKSKTVNVL